MRGIRTGIILTAAAIGLSGCAVFESTPTASQPKTIGSVAIHFTVCASSDASSPPAGSCSNLGNSGSTNSGDGQPGTDPTQIWLGFRVPAGSIAPSSFLSSSTGPANTGPQLRFIPSQQYTEELQRLDSAPKGEMWVGYSSQYFSYNSSSGEQNFTATADFGLPKHKNGAPFAGPFTYLVTVGGRQFSKGSTGPTLPPGAEPIDCQNSLTTGYSAFDSAPTGSSAWICADDSYPSSLNSNATLGTRDAGIVPGKKTSAAPGKKATMSFKFDYVGAAPGATFKFKASTNLRGAKLTVSPGSFLPQGTSSRKIKVKLTVPGHAKAGTYSVKLTAKLHDGESRKAIGKLRVR